MQMCKRSVAVADLEQQLRQRAALTVRPCVAVVRLQNATLLLAVCQPSSHWFSKSCCTNARLVIGTGLCSLCQLLQQHSRYGMVLCTNEITTYTVKDKVRSLGSS